MSVDPMERESPAERRARIFVRQRVRRRIVFVVIALIFLSSAGALFAAWRLMTRPPAGATAEVPLIRADDQPTRRKPSEPGGLAVPDQDSLVLNHGEPKAERLLPPPEAPLPRPTPAPPAAEAPPTPPAAAASPPPAVETPPAAAAAPPSPPSPPQVAANPPAAAAPSAAHAAPEKKTKVAALPPPASAAAGKGYRLQLGSVRTPDAAAKEWARLRQQNQDMLGRLAMSPVRVDLGARGIFYRIQAGPLADAATAERACDELKRRGVGCLLVKP
jgi:pyruvate/2-oxoglutarate dehydrogenase complex dihydrolipoamide acyltransferase (E2) component